MNAEIICVGTELLLGDIVNTNAKFLSVRLAELGFNLFSQSVVGDNAARLEAQLRLSLSRSDLVLLTGGLGPTQDDITKETVAAVLGRPLLMHDESLHRMTAYFEKTGRKMGESNRKQALTIQGATVLANEYGTAPGYYIPYEKGAIVLLPGPPVELQPMFDEAVVPLLKPFVHSIIVSQNVRLFGIGESAAAERCGNLLQMKNPTVATYAKTGEVDIRVTASADDEVQAQERIAPIVGRLREMFGSHVYGIGPQNLQETVVSLLKENRQKLATAESCTAGMLSGRITEVPGSSEVFDMGVTAYANYVKTEALCVDKEILAEKGAVCAEVAAQMAVGVRTLCDSDVSVGITGVAGPGESEGKPAGLVYISLSDRQKVYVRKILCRGKSRESTREIATKTALDMVRRYLQKQEDFLAFGTPIGQPIVVMEGYELPPYLEDDTALPMIKTTGAQPIPAQPMQEESPLSGSEFHTHLDLQNAESLEEMLSLQGEVVSNSSLVREEGLDFLHNDLSEEKDEEQEIKPTQPKEIFDQGVSEMTDNNQSQGPSKKGRFLSSFFPMRGDSFAEILRKCIFILSFLVMIGSMIYLIQYFVEGSLQSGLVKEAAAVWQNEESYERNEEGVLIGFESLMEENEDIRAWIQIEGTNINNPVYQGTDNLYYASHNMNKEPSRYGALFLDKYAFVGKNATSQNLVIYGHHMRDGTMFGPLKHYTDLNFYKKHAVIDFTTLYREGEYKIFSVFITNTKPEHDNGEVFDYRKSDFADDEEFMQFVNDVKVRSVIDTGVDVVATDELITLSTCTYEFDDARLVVVARRVRDDERDTIHNTEAAKVNPYPVYPAVWYTKKGLTKPKNTPTHTENTSSDLTSSAVTPAVSSKSSSVKNTGSANRVSSQSSKKSNTSVTSVKESTASTSSNNETSSSQKMPSDSSQPIVSTPSAFGKPESELSNNPQ